MAATQSWQYKVIPVKSDVWGRDNPDALQSALTDAGREGWELVSTLHVTGAHYAMLFFKRPA